MRRCSCGSGLARERCHGTLSDPELRRTLLDKYVVNPATGLLEVYRQFETQLATQRRVWLRARVMIATTPAGVIHYPLGLIHRNRFIRPMAIDGISYYEGNYVAVYMTLTPTLRTVIFFQDH